MPKQFLIKNATLIQEGHPRHLKNSDILISDGKIKSIAAKIEAKVETISGKSLMVTAGWHDMRTHLADPGYEHKESLYQLCNAAAAGGFTSLSSLPATYPVVDNKAGLQYILNSSKDSLSDIYPYGAVSEGLKGADLAELYDMSTHGAVAFTDGDATLGSGLLKKALLYVKPFNGLIISFPLDTALHHEGQINESEDTVNTGLRSSPSLAEYVCVKQQIDILEYTGGKLHFTGLSSKESLGLIKQAKKKGLNITADTSIFNLCYTDKDVARFDANFKMLPLLRSESDRKALIKAVNEGVIDVVVSNHYAQNIELKKVEFDYASNGALSLQTLYSLYNEHLAEFIEEARFVQCIGASARKVLGLEEVVVKEKNSANLVVVDRKASWSLNKDSNKSLSTNTHLWNKELNGKVIAVFNNNKVNLY